MARSASGLLGDAASASGVTATAWTTEAIL